jgi:alpha-pyrone synthase
MPAFITAIGTANPTHAIQQGEVINFMIKAHGLNDEEAHHLRVLYRASGITNRYTTIPDYANLERTFFPKNDLLEPFPDVATRSNWYRDHAANLSKEAVLNCLGASFDFSQITHLITVSCTGMYAPGLDIDLVRMLDLPQNVERTCINFMGCYAAFNALKLAKHIVDGKDNKVLIGCTELCTLHFQKEKTDDNLLANALFGDGSAAVFVEANPTHKSIELQSFDCSLIPSASEEMAWNIGNFGFEMHLSSYVPDALKSGIPPLLDRLKEKEPDRSFDYYAIHPGGKKILDVVEAELAIDRETNQAAHNVLRKYGNMSSPTVVFVMNEIFQSLSLSDNGKSLLSLAFGPGLTLESLVGKIHTT